MKVLYVWDADYPWDVRVEKICKSFIKQGHEIHLICRNRKKRKIYEYDQGIHIHRLPKITALFSGVISFPFFLNPLWLYAIYKIVSKYKTEIIVVRDLPLALAGVTVARLRKIPCFLDMAEPYPEMLLGYKQLQKVALKKRVVNYFVRNAKLAQIVERISCHLLTHIFPVSIEMKNNLQHKGISASKITVLHNTPDISYVHSTNEKIDLLEIDQNAINIIYVGDLTEARGLPIVVHAIDRLKNRGENFKLIIVGSGRYENQIKKMVNELNLETDIVFTGWIPYEKLPYYLAKGDIGIIPHISTVHNNLTLPNKVFDYMAAGLAIISANLVPIKRIINETSTGVIFEEYTENSLVEALEKLKDEKERQKLGNNGRLYVRSAYNWDHDFSIFINRINDKLKRCKNDADDIA